MAYVPDSFLLEHGLRRGHLFAPVKSTLCAKECKLWSWPEKSRKLGQQNGWLSMTWIWTTLLLVVWSYDDRCTCPYMCNTDLCLYLWFYEHIKVIRCCCQVMPLRSQTALLRGWAVQWDAIFIQFQLSHPSRTKQSNAWPKDFRGRHGFPVYLV